jgi:ParB family chromosome partitioning protein
LDDLKHSILEHGIIQPITVRRVITGYELIAGERRLRASISAGLEKIPAFIIDIETGIEMLEIAIIENVQRENLNPIEVASGYQRLIEECSLTQEQVANKVGKDRTSIANFLRLLRLPDKIQESLRQRSITMGHARALLGVTDKELIVKVWEHLLEKSLSVRAVEQIVKDIELGKDPLGLDQSKQKKDKVKPNKPTIEEQTRILLNDSENTLRHIYGTNVKINTKTMESGTFEFEFYSKDDFERLFDIFSDTGKSNI